MRGKDFGCVENNLVVAFSPEMEFIFNQALLINYEISASKVLTNTALTTLIHC